MRLADLTTYHPVDPFQSYCLLRHRFHSRHFLVQRQDVWHGSHGRDGERVDLRVALGVVLLDVRELGRAAEGFVVPVQVSHPPSRKKKKSVIQSSDTFDRYAAG